MVQLIQRETSTMTYKCQNQLAPTYLSECFSKLSDYHTGFLRNSGTDVHIPRMKTSNGQKSFAYRWTKVWNDLDSETKLASSMQCFKSRLKTKYGPLTLETPLSFSSFLFISLLSLAWYWRYYNRSKSNFKLFFSCLVVGL